MIPKWQRLEQLKELAKAYADYEPYKAVLVMYENTRADLKTLLAEGEKITPKAWRTEKEQLEKEMPAEYLIVIPVFLW